MKGREGERGEERERERERGEKRERSCTNTAASQTHVKTQTENDADLGKSVC